jgi:pimeloyl-ACP methyl ester carboxylesterase
MTQLDVRRWGQGVPVVLVHGSLTSGEENWEGQRSLADEGYRLVAPDRRGYGDSPKSAGEDFLRDGEDIAELLGDGAHLVGHSYGGMGAMVAAERRPDAVLSLTLIEPPAFGLCADTRRSLHSSPGRETCGRRAS